MTQASENYADTKLFEAVEDSIRDVLEGEPEDYPLEQHHLEEMLGDVLDRVQERLG